MIRVFRLCAALWVVLLLAACASRPLDMKGLRWYPGCVPEHSTAEAPAMIVEEASQAGMVKIQVPAEELEAFSSFVAEGGELSMIPDCVMPQNELTPAVIATRCRGDKLLLLGYARNQQARLFAIMVPYRIDETTRMITLGFHGACLRFDMEEARLRWKHLKRDNRPSEQMSEVADHLIAKAEEALALAK